MSEPLWTKYIKHISVSQIRTHRRNPRRWALEKLAGLPSCGSPATEIGKDVHDVLEHYVKDGVDKAESTISKHCLAAFVRGLDEDAQLQDVDWGTAELEREIRLILRPDLPPILGYIDVFGRTADGTLLVIDHKTSRARRYFLDEQGLADDVQMHVYAYWALVMHPKEDRVIVQHNQFAYGNKRDVLKTVRTELTREDLEWRTASLEQEIETGILNTIELFDKGGIGNVPGDCAGSCRNAYGPNSCEYWSVCCGEVSDEEFTRAAGTVELNCRQTLAQAVDKIKGGRLTESLECDSIKSIKEGVTNVGSGCCRDSSPSAKSCDLGELMARARDKYKSIANTWDRRDTMTEAIVKYVNSQEGLEYVVLPSHMREKLSPDYEPVVTQLKELGYNVFVRL